MKLLVIILFLAVPLLLIMGNFLQRLRNRYGQPRRSGILMTFMSLLVLITTIFEDQIFDWFYEQFGAVILLYMTIWMGYVAALALIHEILCIVLLQKKLKIIPFLLSVLMVALGVYCIVNTAFLGEVLERWASANLV